MIFLTYDTYSWCRDSPTNFPPEAWIVANHVAKPIVKSIDTKGPGYCNAFREHEEEETKSADCVRIQKLKHVHASL